MTPTVNTLLIFGYLATFVACQLNGQGSNPSFVIHPVETTAAGAEKVVVNSLGFTTVTCSLTGFSPQTIDPALSEITLLNEQWESVDGVVPVGSTKFVAGPPAHLFREFEIQPNTTLDALLCDGRGQLTDMILNTKQYAVKMIAYVADNEMTITRGMDSITLTCTAAGDGSESPTNVGIHFILQDGKGCNLRSNIGIIGTMGGTNRRGQAVYEWFRNGDTQLDIGGLATYSTTAKGRNLVIEKPRVRDAGQYKCKVTFQGTQQPLFASFTVFAVPRVGKMKNQKLDEGVDVEIECKAFGYPIEGIKWYYEGKMLDAESGKYRLGNMTIDGIVHPQRILTISNLSRSDRGEYRCKPYNLKGEAEEEESRGVSFIRVNDPLAVIWPVVGIVVEVIVLIIVIFFCERRRLAKRREEAYADGEVASSDKKQNDGMELRHRTVNT